MKYLPALAGIAAALAVLLAFRFDPARTLLWTDAAIIAKGNRFAVAMGIEAACVITAGLFVYSACRHVNETT